MGRSSRGLSAVACGALLAGPTVLAFFTGGYFSEAQTWAGLLAWALVAASFVLRRKPLPAQRGGVLAIGGLVALAAWTLISFTWAPVAGDAYHAGQRVVLYAGVLIAAAALLRELRAQRATVPALIAGTVIVIGYGLSERFFPGVLHFTRSVTATGRLEQPLTYWNAMGELAALGCVLCAALAGDAGRDRRLRIAAACAAAPLWMGLYISFSRGALFAVAAGLVALIVMAPRREQLGALLINIATAVLAVVAVAPFHGVTGFAGRLGTREAQGAVVLILLIAIATAAGFAQWQLARRERIGPIALTRRAPWIAVALICGGLALAITIGSHESTGHPLSGGATRLASFQSNRYAYWSVALRAFSAEPIRGVGAGGWAVWWLRYRKFNEFAQDAHSLELQTLAELGLIGIVLLAAFLAGGALAVRRAHGSQPLLAAGPAAGAVTYLAHSPLDWDWQMPALTLVALVLLGALIALAEGDRPAAA